MKNILTVWLTLAIVISLFNGCSRASAPIGIWNAASGETIEFLKDGSFTLKNLPSDKKLNVGELGGTYTMIDSTHLKLEITTPGGKNSSIYQFSISGDELSFEDSVNHQIKKYQRAK